MEPVRNLAIRLRGVVKRYGSITAVDGWRSRAPRPSRAVIDQEPVFGLRCQLLQATWSAVHYANVLGAVSHLNELDWHDMLLFGGIGVGVIIVIARLLMRG
jgi:hypothetical protein